MDRHWWHIPPMTAKKMLVKAVAAMTPSRPTNVRARPAVEYSRAANMAYRSKEVFNYWRWF